MIEQTIELLGFKAKDRVSGIEGVITSICFDLYGCVQALLTAPAVDNERKGNDYWYDVQRLEVSSERVMSVPDFNAKAATPAEYQHGAADKPCPR